ncbi:MAG: ABC transporter permease subunit, partial [Desulfobacteraceae bacterium]|nr:ABC transporter permease subunit [Desulfobacteraceae bacterium]
GMGLYVTQSILALDFPAVTGFTLLIGVIVQFLNLFVDVSYVFLDPRIRHA